MGGMETDGRNIKKILMTADTVGGVWSYALELSSCLQKYDIEVHLAVMGSSMSAQQQKDAENLENLTVHEGNFKLEWMQDPWEDVHKAGEWLLFLEKEIDPDIIHLNGYVHGSYNFSAPVLVVAHSDVLSWWYNIKKDEAPAEWNIYREKVQKGLAAADLVVAVSNTMMSYIDKYYGPISKKEVIYNGRRIRNYTPGKKMPFIFSMGRIWDEAKNLKVLAEAASEVNWIIKIAGNNRNPENRLSIDLSNVELLGELPHIKIKEILSKASIAAFPGKYEPFGLAALEAGLSGCALVLADIETYHELWEDAAIFVDPDNPKKWVRVLNELIEDDSYRNRLIKRSRERALKYNASRMAEHYYEIYEYLLNNKSKKSMRKAI